METQVLEKPVDTKLFQLLMKELEEQDEKEYPEFDDLAPMWHLNNRPPPMKIRSPSAKIKRSEKPLSDSLIEELLETNVFYSDSKEVLSPEAQQLIHKLSTWGKFMSYNEALAILRSAKNGSEILNLLDKVTEMFSEEVDEEECDDWVSKF